MKKSFTAIVLLAAAMAVSPAFAQKKVLTVGMGSALKLARGKNELWTKGGLLYTPPFQ